MNSPVIQCLATETATSFTSHRLPAKYAAVHFFKDLRVETIFFIDGAITIVLLVVHLADYFMSWPERPFTVHQPYRPIDGPRGIARRPLPEPLSYDRAA